MANGLVTKIAGTIISVSIAATGTGVIANEVRNVKSHEDIRKEFAIGDKEILKKVDKVEDIVTDIRLEQRTMTEILKRIEMK